jgi:magnesium chelatase subunit H
MPKFGKYSLLLMNREIGPDLLKYVPGEKVRDLRTWIEAYRYWNQGGSENVRSMVHLISGLVRGTYNNDLQPLPPLQMTPDIGLIHPLMMVEGEVDDNDEGHATHRRRFQYSYDDRPRYMESASEYLRWRLSSSFKELAHRRGFPMAKASDNPPRVAVLLYRKHVITQQRYILDLITMMESSGLLPIPIFINGQRRRGPCHRTGLVDIDA